MPNEKLIVEANMKVHEELKRQYIAQGVPEKTADDLATAEIRRVIRESPPIRGE